MILVQILYLYIKKTVNINLVFADKNEPYCMKGIRLTGLDDAKNILIFKI